MNADSPARLICLNKPYGVLSQFTPEGRWRGLKDIIEMPGVYVAGRLDADSEGLLLLTDNGALLVATVQAGKWYMPARSKNAPATITVTRNPTEPHKRIRP